MAGVCLILSIGSSWGGFVIVIGRLEANSRNAVKVVYALLVVLTEAFVCCAVTLDKKAVVMDFTSVIPVGCADTVDDDTSEKAKETIPKADRNALMPLSELLLHLGDACKRIENITPSFCLTLTVLPARNEQAWSKARISARTLVGTAAFLDWFGSNKTQVDEAAAQKHLKVA